MTLGGTIVIYPLLGFHIKNHTRVVVATTVTSLGRIIVLVAVATLGAGMDIIALGGRSRSNRLSGVLVTSCLGFVTTVAVTARTSVLGVTLAFAGGFYGISLVVVLWTATVSASPGSVGAAGAVISGCSEGYETPRMPQPHAAG